MKFVNEKILKKIREDYPVGTRIKLIKMNDVQAPPLNSKGTVLGIDDVGSIMVEWDNGSHLSIIYGEDKVEKLTSVCCVVTSKIYVEVEADTPSHMKEAADDIITNMDFGDAEDIQWKVLI